MVDDILMGRMPRFLHEKAVIAIAAILAIAALVALVSLRPIPQTHEQATSLANPEHGPLRSAMLESRSQRRTSAQAEAGPSVSRDRESDAGGAMDSGSGVASLWDIGGRQELLASGVEDYLDQLVEFGEGALPEIEAFLRQGEDLRFLATGRGRSRGDYRSLRRALFEVLHRIGGDRAESVLAEELQYTADPLEIATLARLLEDLTPEKYRDQAVHAARETLALAWQGEVKGKDLTPLFQVYRDYGDAREAASVLHRNLWKEWGPSAMVALAELDKKAGLPLLTRMARSSVEDRPEVDAISQRRLLALRMLAQLSPHSGKAREVLFEQASRDRIPDRLWSTLASAIAGDEQLRIDASRDASDSVGTRVVGDHVLYVGSESAQLTHEEARARIELIDELRAVALSPDAMQSLENAEAVLQRSYARN